MATATKLPVTDQTGYRNFRNNNGCYFDGRVQHVDLIAGKDGEQFAAVTVVTNLSDDEDGIAIKFNSKGTILKLALNKHLMVGRRVTVHGRITGFANAYVNDGKLTGLNRPRINMRDVRLDLGAKPKSAMADA